MSKFRTQWDVPLPVKVIDFPPSIVQPGMSPSISQMVKTRSVGGNLDEYEMDGVFEDAPFDSEYYDYFDMEDLAQEVAADQRGSSESVPAERQAGEKTPSDQGKPQNSENQQVNIDS